MSACCWPCAPSCPIFRRRPLFITFFGGLLKGLLGYGYWLSAPALLLTGLLLLTHRDRPATLRSVCTMLVPVLTGCGLHLLLCARSYEPGLTGLRELWLSGRSLQSGGACPAVWPWASPPYSARCCL